MNRHLILFFIPYLNATFCILSCYSQESDPVKTDPDLRKKVVRTTLNQSEPAVVRVGLQGVTTLEFPAKIEAINGYGFAVQPKPDTDEFQLIYDKGTNFLSLKALRADVRANLTVVLNEKVYCFYCEEASDPSFVEIFGAPGENRFVATGEPQTPASDKKAVSRDRLLSFLDQVKTYSALQTSAPDSIASLRAVEPNKRVTIGQIETVIKRVVSDRSLGLTGFEVQLGNRSQSDFYFDPEGFSVRVGDARYDACISDAGGIVPAQTSVPVFFVVTGAATNGGPNDLSVDQDFDLLMRPTNSAANANLAATFTEPPVDHLPTAADAAKDENKADNAGKGDLRKADKEPKKKNKNKEVSAQLNAKDHTNKPQEPGPKKHWLDLFRRNTVTAQ
jgi:hypothetical protein